MSEVHDSNAHGIGMHRYLCGCTRCFMCRIWLHPCKRHPERHAPAPSTQEGAP